MALNLNRHELDDFGPILAPISTEAMDRVFELESGYMLKVRLQDSLIWTKLGSMVAYEGRIDFKRSAILEHGLKKLFKKVVMGEGLSLTRADGNGCLYLADGGKKIRILSIQDQPISVNANDLLAFEESVQWDVNIIKSAAMMAGGLSNVTLNGCGLIAITTHFEPLTLKVTPDNPIFTDPNATVAWSANLQPKLKTQTEVRSFLGRGSGESIHLKFEGEGFVVVQPFEELAFQQAQSSQGSLLSTILGIL
jgi:uncharacterized protein (AIM24 family)